MRLTRPIVAGLAGLLVAAGCGGAAPNVYTRGSTRRYDVRILRDTFGVPHIRGHTDADVAYGVAYAQAEDDYPTMEAVFIASRGRNGAANGKEGAVTDYLLHLMRVREAVTRHADSAITPATKDLLEGYVAGFNKYAALHPSEVSSVARGLYLRNCAQGAERGSRSSTRARRRQRLERFRRGTGSLR
jgi:acyl-homoserine-lactone acylase